MTERVARACRPRAIVRGFAAGAVLAVAWAASATADWTERPFNPPVGSRWIIRSDAEEVDTRPQGVRTTSMKTQAEVTYTEKMATGFRITYLTRDVAIDGNAPQVALMRPVLGLMKDIVIRAETDASGKPLRVENLDEVRPAIQAMIDRIVAAAAGKPQVAAAIRQMMTAMLVDDDRAATTYLDILPTLALGQNTGLKPGETRPGSDAMPNPFGGTPLKSVSTLRIAKTDAATGAVRLVRTQTFDAESIKEFARAMLKQMGGVGGVSQQEMEKVIKQIALTMDGRTEIDVEDGMTRAVRDESTLTISAMGQTLTKRETKRVSVEKAE